MIISELESMLLKSVPLTEKMGLQVLDCSSTRIELQAPLELNHNHKQTAFGGSLAGLQALSCWSWVMNQLDLNGIKAEVVLQDSLNKYIRPVKEDLVAVCEDSSQEKLDAFLLQLKKHGKGRIELESKVFSNGELATLFSGRYVAILKK